MFGIMLQLIFLYVGDLIVPGGDVYSARRDLNDPETLSKLECCFRLLAGARRGSLPNTPANARILLSRCLNRAVFDCLKHRLTCRDHSLFDVIWPALEKFSKPNTRGTNSRPGSRVSSSYEDDFTGHVIVPDYESYVVFSEFLDPLIRHIHCVTASGELPDQPMPCFFYMNEKTKESLQVIQSFDLDPSGNYIISGQVSCCRNLENYPMPLTLTLNQLEESEREIIKVLVHPELGNIMSEGSSEDEPGSYYTLIEVLVRPSDVRVRLAAAGLLSPIIETEETDQIRLHGKNWPHGRGVYLAAAGDLAVWVNVEDHIRVICSTNAAKPGKLGKAYVRLARLMNILDQKMTFKRNSKLGFLSARPTRLGNTLRFRLSVKFQALSKDPGNLKHLSIVRGLEYEETSHGSIVVIGNQQSLCITELQTFQDFSKAVLNILSLETDMKMNNFLTITKLITNMFREKKFNT